MRLLKEQTDGIVETIETLQTTEVDPALLASNKMTLKYALLACPAIVAFFLLMKMASEPTVPTITMNDATATNTPIANVPSAVSKTTETKLVVTPQNTSKDVLLPNESIATLPSAASLPVKESAEAAKTDVALADKTPEELVDIEAKKKANKKAEEAAQKNAAQKNAAEVKPQHGTVHNQQVVVTKTEAKKTADSEKSGFETFKESIKQGSESKCTQAQIAMKQCNQ